MMAFGLMLSTPPFRYVPLDFRRPYQESDILGAGEHSLNLQVLLHKVQHLFKRYDVQRLREEIDASI